MRGREGGKVGASTPVLLRALGFSLSLPLPVYPLASWKKPPGKTTRDLRGNVYAEERTTGAAWPSLGDDLASHPGQLKRRLGKWRQQAMECAASPAPRAPSELQAWSGHTQPVHTGPGYEGTQGFLSSEA